MKVYFFNNYKFQDWVKYGYIFHLFAVTICKVGKDKPWNFWEVHIHLFNMEMRIDIGNNLG